MTYKSRINDIIIPRVGQNMIGSVYSSGRLRIPSTPVIKVSGRKITEKTVNVFIISFMRKSKADL